MSKNIIFSVLISICVIFSVNAQKKKKKNKEIKSISTELTLNDIFVSGAFYSRSVSIKMTKDGNYTQTHFDRERGIFSIVKYSFANTFPLDTLYSTNNNKGLPKDFIPSDYEVSKNSNYLILQGKSKSIYRHSFEAQYYIYSVKAKRAKPVADTAYIMYPEVSPNELFVSYVYNNNLAIQNFKTNKTIKITTEGEINKIMFGKVDWVYEEEFSMSKGYEWSPDGSKIIFYEFNEQDVKEYQLPVYDELYPTQYAYKYPKVGEKNSKVFIQCYDLKTNLVTDVFNPDNEEWIEYTPRMGWVNNSKAYYYNMNRHQNLLTISVYDFNLNKTSKVYEEESKTYVDIPNKIVFLEDNSFIITSEKSGFNDILRYSFDGKLMNNIYANKKDVESLLDYDPINDWVYFIAHDPSPLDKILYRTKLNGNNLEKIISKVNNGIQTASLNSNSEYLVVNYQSTNILPVSAIYNNKLQEVKVLENNESTNENFIKFGGVPKREYTTFPISTDVSLNGWVMLPSNFTPVKKYPVMFTVYGGPGHQTVLNNHPAAMDMWYRYLNDKGIIVVAIDNRGTGGRGADYKKITYKKLGEIESDDVIAAAKYFAKQSYVDEKRIGIYGWSFGGFISATCLLKGNDIFKLAVSVAPVTDWRFYDNIYTERYMGLLNENLTGYENTSVMKHISNFNKGNLLLIHGTFDDNVHPQNSFVFLRKLQEANKLVDSEFYTDKNHGIYGGQTRLHLFNKISSYIINNL
jgi:dipeptidyl-peptidase-4